MTQEYFSVSDHEGTPLKFETIFFHDEWSIREVLPHEIKAFFEFKDLMEITGEENELSFLLLVERARELEEAFKKCRNIFKKKESK